MRKLWYRICALGCWLLFAVPCAAQAPEAETAEKSYVTSYFIVGLGIALGLVAICRPSKRRKEVRAPE